MLAYIAVKRGGIPLVLGTVWLRLAARRIEKAKIWQNYIALQTLQDKLQGARAWRDNRLHNERVLFISMAVQRLTGSSKSKLRKPCAMDGRQDSDLSARTFRKKKPDCVVRIVLVCSVRSMHTTFCMYTLMLPFGHDYQVVFVVAFLTAS
jgi:hypothetical protein